jgi:hypothetical protein
MCLFGVVGYVQVNHVSTCRNQTGPTSRDWEIFRLPSSSVCSVGYIRVGLDVSLSLKCSTGQELAPLEGFGGRKFNGRDIML